MTTIRCLAVSMSVCSGDKHASLLSHFIINFGRVLAAEQQSDFNATSVHDEHHLERGFADVIGLRQLNRVIGKSYALVLRDDLSQSTCAYLVVRKSDISRSVQRLAADTKVKVTSYLCSEMPEESLAVMASQPYVIAAGFLGQSPKSMSQCSIVWLKKG